MNHAGGESGKQSQIQQKKSKIDDFVQAIANIAVAQICESVGFQGFQQSAVDTLADITVRYVRDLGKNSNRYANLANRTESNVFDVIQGLEDLGLSNSVKGISEYVNVSAEIPFAYSIPEFPVNIERDPVKSFARNGEEPPEEHIPNWLPVFPSIEDKKDDENGSELIKNDDSKAIRKIDNNPFLDSPIGFGEREVSSVVLPPSLVQNHLDATNYVSAFETFAPAIELVKNTVCDSIDVREKSAVVQFKVGSDKKSPKARTASWFGNENLKDDKKRRVEQILKESIENPHELAQL